MIVKLPYNMVPLTGVRSSSAFNETVLNETEQDANSVLTELDKGIRSSKLGVQCEAIVRFPRLFEKYPFPILINSSFLKLAEFFWTGSNLLRFWVLRVCKQSENHLDKILNIDAFVKRIYMVMHANEPIARALTLRTLGAVSRVIQEKQQVHHAIRRALDSHDTIEVEAAIYASGQFAAQSRTFAISMCAKISDMIESLKIPLPMKLQLIPVLRHMHHDANTAALVKVLCRKLLPKYPAESFVIAILDTLTQLSARTLTDIPDQIQLLLVFLDDQRAAVRCLALKSLTILADEHCVHAWPKSALGELISKAKLHANAREQFLFLRILQRLCECTLICHALFTEKRVAVEELVLNCLCSQEYQTASQAMCILSALVVYAYEPIYEIKAEYDVAHLMQLVNLNIEGLIICTIGDSDHMHSLRRLMRTGIKISTVHTEFGQNYVHILCNLLSDSRLTLPAENASLVCDAIAGICSHFQLQKCTLQSLHAPQTDTVINIEPVTDKPHINNPIRECLPQLLLKLDQFVTKYGKSGKHAEAHNLHVVESLICIVLINLIGCFMPADVTLCLLRCTAQLNNWVRFRIARSAARFGQHYLAAHLYSNIARNVSVDKMLFYLRAVAQMEQAECVLNHGVTYTTMAKYYQACAQRASKTSVINIDNLAQLGVDGVPHMSLTLRLNTAVQLYRQASANLRASSSPMHGFSFQLEFLKLRAQFLQVLHTAVTVKNAHVTVPPPAIASSLAQSSRDYLQKFGHITNQLRKLVKALKACADSYARLHKSAFDADPNTLEYLALAQYQASLLAYVVETICFAMPSDAPSIPLKGSCPETCYYAASCQRMEQLVQQLPQEPNNAKTIDNCHLNVITAEIELIVRTPICMPRYFYQQLQSTSIKLSVIPQPRNVGDAILVQAGSNLVIKVEGVILHYGKVQEHYRQVESVQLVLSQTAIPPRGNLLSSYGEIIKGMDTVTLSQTVKPQRQFLSGSFLVPISSGGQWQVVLETYIIDEHGNTWCTGPKHSMLVRVLEDPAKTSAMSSHAGRHRF